MRELMKNLFRISRTQVRFWLVLNGFILLNVFVDRFQKHPILVCLEFAILMCNFGVMFAKWFEARSTVSEFVIDRRIIEPIQFNNLIYLYLSISWLTLLVYMRPIYFYFVVEIEDAFCNAKLFILVFWTNTNSVQIFDS